MSERPGPPDDGFEAAFRLFEAVCDLEGDALEQALARAERDDPHLAREVRELLARDRDPLPLEAPALARELLAAPPVPSELAGFRVLSVLGAGGMGVVYEAEQSAPRRRVALKLLRPGLFGAERLRRLHTEAEALGRLDHPGVARVWASGTADVQGAVQPWLAMELVRGERIDRWCALCAATREERLELLARVCDAVQHAHERGVVHRDLKPANVLVEAGGRPRVLDFGLARLVGPDLERTTLVTATGELLGTLAYMSPEQALGDSFRVDAQSDVYALGVLGYELLAGRRPLELETTALCDAARRIEHEEPPSLGALDPALAGDVEVIVARAMAKEKWRRYESASALAADLRRFLAHEPIRARPPSRAYRARRLVRRHRAAFAALALVLGVLAAGATTSTLLWLRVRSEAARNAALAERSRDEARTAEALRERTAREARNASETLAFLEALLSPEAGAEGTPRVLTARELIERAARRVPDALQAEPGVRARLLGALGKACIGLGHRQRAEPLLEEAEALARTVHGAGSLEHARLLHQLANCRAQGTRAAEAARDLRAALAVVQRELGPESDEAATLQNDLGIALGSLGEPDEAIALFRESLRVHELHWGKDHRRTDPAKVNLAGVLLSVGRLPDAEALLRDALATASNPSATIGALLPLAQCLTLQQRHAEAEEVARRAERLAAERYGPTSVICRNARSQVASSLGNQGRVEEALPMLLECAAQAEELDGPESTITLGALHDLAYALADVPARRDEAEALFHDLLGRVERAFGPDHPLASQAHHNLAFLYLDQGRLEEAEREARVAWEARVRVLGETSALSLLSLKARALVARRAGELEQALALRRRALAGARGAFGERSPMAQEMRVELAGVLRQLGRAEEAEPLLREVVAIAEQTGERPDMLAQARAWLDEGAQGARDADAAADGAR